MSHRAVGDSEEFASSVFAMTGEMPDGRSGSNLPENRVLRLARILGYLGVSSAASSFSLADA
jgi:hypothetical protein